MAGVWRCLVCGRSDFVTGRESAAWFLHWTAAHMEPPPPDDDLAIPRRRRR